jgi:hypothetical protein
MTPFEQFIKERRYLNNVSERSIEWYGLAFKWLQTENPTQADLKQTVIKMREDGLSARSINSYRPVGIERPSNVLLDFLIKT